MRRINIFTIIIGLVIISLILFAFTVNIYARGGGSYKAPNTRHILPPIVIPPPRPSVFIQYKWSPEDIVKTFNENNLKIGKTEPVNKADYKSLPAKAKEAIRFTIPSIGEDAIGCILSFEIKTNMEKIKEHYLKLNNKDELYSWSFTKDNVIVVLNGLISEEKAKLFERALNNLR